MYIRYLNIFYSNNSIFTITGLYVLLIFFTLSCVYICFKLNRIENANKKNCCGWKL